MMKKMANKIIVCLVILAHGMLPLALAQGTSLETISAEQSRILMERHKGDPDFETIDVRTPREFKAGHIEGAVLMDYYSSDYLKKLRGLDRNKTYLIYCRSGNRSLKTLGMIKKMGFRKVFNMGRGMNQWHANGYRIVK
jgi:rhodanese-related sulfurtransferase